MASQRVVEVTTMVRAAAFWDLLAAKVAQVPHCCQVKAGESRVERMSLSMVHFPTCSMAGVARVLAGLTQAKLSMVELTRCRELTRANLNSELIIILNI